MHLKTFHAPSIQDAIRQARRELGPDAMLLNSRRVTQPNDKAPTGDKAQANDRDSVFAVTFATAQAPGANAAEAAPAGGAMGAGTQTQPSRSSGASTHGAGDAASAKAAGSGAKATERPSRAAQAYGSENLNGSNGTRSAARPGEAVADSSARADVSGTRADGSGARAGNPGARGTSPEVEATRGASSDASGTDADLQQRRVRKQTEDLAGVEEGNTRLPSYEKLFEQMTSMRREMLLLAGSVRRASAANYRQDLPSEELRWVHDVLLSQDFYPETIEEVIEQIAPRLAQAAPGAAPAPNSGKSRKRAAARKEQSPSSAGLLQMLRENLGSRIELAPEPSIRRRTGSPHLVALVGPPGVGKTTTLVKLAARYGANSRFPLQVISMDNYRVAASEQLRTYSSVLGVGFDALTSAAALEKALRQYEAKELILIDTPGYGWRDFAAAEDLAALLRQSESATIHLVVSASMKPSDLARVADLYELFGYHSILFTKVDETATIGPLVSESCLRRKPLSYLCAGQRIPEDIEVATRERILDRVLPAALSSEEFAA
ncbi:MAG: hypothetical protein MUF01_11740 [Bryobacterales bacterium]|jgi:flagellar biosynthesis protein FlhF|nr:hypothetical protein [Bryobacterales bacterium]